MDKIKFDRISIDQGLSQSSVYSIIQDREGFIWLATEEGLNRFDGKHFKIYKKDHTDNKSLCYSWLKSLYEDKNGNIWIGTLNGYIVRYDKLNDLFVNIKVDSEIDKSKSEITSIIESGEGILWVSTFNGGVKSFKIGNNEKVCNNIDEVVKNKDISSICKDSHNFIWLGTWNNGIYKLQNNHLELSQNELNYNICLTALQNISIRCIYEDSNENIWVGTNQGLYFYDRLEDKLNEVTEISKKALLDITITSICEDLNKIIWIGSKSKGLYRINFNDEIQNYRFEENDKNSLSNDTIRCLFVDKSNVLWIGTSGGGVSRLNCGYTGFLKLESCISRNKKYFFNSVMYNYMDKSNLHWIGTYNNGLHVLNKNVSLDLGNYYSISKEHNLECITHIVEDFNNNMWISGLAKDGLLKYNRGNNEFRFIKHLGTQGINSLCLNENYLWIATRSLGLLLFDIDKEEFIQINNESVYFEIIKKDMVFCLFLDSLKNLWIGTVDEGLFCYNFENNEIFNYKFDEKNQKSISDNLVLSVNEDKENNIWIGTVDGLNLLNRSNNSFTRYSITNGLPNNMIKGIIPDDSNNLWISTNKGLSKFNLINQKFRNYDVNDGLQSNEFNDGAFLKDEQGIIYFGGINGITYFHPSEIKDNPYIPNIVITDFEIFNQPVNGSEENPFLKKNIVYADEINLTYKESVFSFRFASLIFNNPQKNQYAYKMEGFDKEWTYCGTRKRVTYTNLNPGSYVFKVKGSNNDGIWNEDGTSIKINISPPYWKTWWFKGLGLLGAFALTGYTYRQRMEKLAKESRDQEDFSRKLIEVQENEKMRIAHALHDTIAHDVLISKNKALLALKHRDNKAGLERTLEEISELATNTITDVRNISYDLHPHQLERLGFTKTIRSIINEVSKSTNIKFEFESENVDELLSKESEINLFRVVQESISNIIKHSGATEAILTVSKVENHLLIVLIDNGRGFDVNSKEYNKALQGFGISGIIERIKFMNGEIKLDSDIGKGTTLRFQIPIKKKNE